MRLRSPSIFLVCLLALTTLWVSEAAASHIHLDNDNLSCDICHSSGNGGIALESKGFSSELLPTSAPLFPALETRKLGTSAAPRNSRAPPSLG